MNLTNASDRQDLVDWAKELIRVLAGGADRYAVEGVEQAVTGLLSDRFSLAVLGKAKRGKSTLLNAILGRSDDVVAPVDRLPASSAISRFRWVDTERAIVVFRDGRREQIGFERIREFVTEEFNPENSKGVDVVEIEGPFPGLDRDLTLIDTPGAGSIHEHHDVLLHAFIPQADAVIFLVTARMPLDQDELDLLRKVRAADIRKVFFAVNKVDECSREDIMDAIAHNRRLLSEAGIHTDRMHQISAKAAFKGDLTGSGVGGLMEEISDFLRANKGRVLSTRFMSRVNAAVEPVSQGVAVQVVSNRKSAEELDTELAILRRQRSVLEAERAIVEREFSTAWSKAVDEYERGLKEAETSVTAAIITKVQRTSVFEVAALGKQLPTLIASTIEEHLRPVASRFEETARDACQRIQTNYPSLNVGDGGSVVIRAREGQTVIAGAVGGAAVTAAGTGFAITGAGTAAGIAAANAAAATAATTTITAPSVLSGLLSLVGLEALAPLATGTATVAAPAALTTTPLWVALSGPVGWTLAGVGVLVVPLSWRLSKLKMKDKIEEACEEQIASVFRRLQTERLPALRKMGETIVAEIGLRLDRQLAQIESALEAARDRRPDETETARLAALNRDLRRLLARCSGMDAGW